MHPIHYSLIFNLAMLAVLGWLSYEFREPLLIVLGLILAQHAMAKFQDEGDDDLEDEQPMGFTADVR